ncbi:PREDICTED: O-acyltransferase WSD1-like [Camelina sativa]|uniref:O-acyltransferase WSD1-like n=1 Tax=Camelina sativa TaxID=90675 RepID=A0ABM0V4R9_CAMSA|nr:PREDICTED: O-acyltransferase WSD1-like [Camelina sativa]
MISEEDEDGEPLSPMARVFQSPGNDCCILTMIGCKTKINADIIQHALKLNVSKHPRFSSRLSDDGACWIKTQVNVENHVVEPDIDPGEIGDNGEGYVEDYVSRLTMLPLDKSRPLWDMHILNVKTLDAEAVCVIRSHHSLGDGTSLMSLLVACTQNTSHRDTIPTIPVLKRTVHKDIDVPWFLRLVLLISSSVRLICNTLVDLLLLLASALFLKDTKTPLKGDVGVENNQKMFCHRIVSLDDIKLIKKVMNMTINDVLLGVTQAALSRYLSDFPGKIRLTAGVFVNLRSNVGIKPLADMMAKDSKCRWGNYFSSIALPISIGLETDPLLYLSKAQSAMDRKKHSLQAALAYSMTEYIFNIFGTKVGAIFPERIVSNTTTLISNMIGPEEEISFLGHPIAYIAPSVYGHAHALTIHFLSYAEKMVISLGVDPTVIPNPHKLCDEMEDSLQAMKATISERGLL